MASQSIEIRAAPSEVWAVLSDGEAYGRWVVGTTRIRSVEPSWPAPGARLHFTVGVAGVGFNDTTVVRAMEAERLLELEAHAWPMGTARISVQIAPRPGGCLVTIDEHPLRGPAARVHNVGFDALFWLRHLLMLRRLRREAEAAGTPPRP